MQLTIDRETAGIYRQGIELRIEKLKKLRKETEALNLPIHTIEEQIELARNAQLYLDDQRDFVAEDRVKRGEKNDDPRQISVDQALEGVEEEAADRAHNRLIRAALSSLLAPVRVPPKWLTGEPILENEIAAFLCDVFQMVRHVSAGANEEADIEWPGVFMYEPDEVPAGGRTFYWCGVTAANAVPAFWFQIDPRSSWRETAATLRGQPLFDLMRSLYKLVTPPEELAPAAEPTEKDLINAWVLETYPKAASGDLAGALQQALHTTALSNPPGAAQAWYAMHVNGATDSDIWNAIETALVVRGNSQNKFGWTEATGVHDSGDDRVVKYVPIEAQLSPLQLTAGKNKKKQTIGADMMVTMLRSILSIELPTEAAEFVEADYEIVDDEVGNGNGHSATENVVDLMGALRDSMVKEPEPAAT